MVILNNEQIDLLSDYIVDSITTKNKLPMFINRPFIGRKRARIGIPTPSELPKEYKYLTKEAISEVLKKGTSANLNFETAEYERFSEAVSSSQVGKLNLKGCIVIKAGENVSTIEKQASYICGLKQGLKDLFPIIIAVKKKNDICVCLMEFADTYISLHEMLFNEKYTNWQIINSLDKILELLMDIYSREFDNKNLPNTILLYQNYRIEESVSLGKKRYEDGQILISDDLKSIFPNGINSLYESKLIVDGQFIKPFAFYQQKLYQIWPSISPNFVTWIHGDLHPGNVLVNLNMPGGSIKFIDPNPDFEKGSDYLYDMGKLLHWLDMIQFVIRERELKSEIFNLDIKRDGDICNIAYKMDKKYMDSRSIYFDYTYNKVKSMGETFKEEKLLQRLNLSIASAYIGGLKYFDNFKHIVVSYSEALRYIDKTIQLLEN